MKNLFLSRSVRMSSLAILVTSGLFFAGCNKNDNDDDQNMPVAGLMAFNLAVDKPAVGFALSGSNLTNAPLEYTNYTGAYLQIYPGSREVESYDFNASGATIATETGNFEAQKYYSVFVVGSDSMYKNIIVNDDVDTLSDPTTNTE